MVVFAYQKVRLKGLYPEVSDEEPIGPLEDVRIAVAKPKMRLSIPLRATWVCYGQRDALAWMDNWLAVAPGLRMVLNSKEYFDDDANGPNPLIFRFYVTPALGSSRQGGPYHYPFGYESTLRRVANDWVEAVAGSPHVDSSTKTHFYRMLLLEFQAWLRVWDNEEALDQEARRAGQLIGTTPEDLKRAQERFHRQYQHEVDRLKGAEGDLRRRISTYVDAIPEAETGAMSAP